MAVYACVGRVFALWLREAAAAASEATETFGRPDRGEIVMKSISE